MGKVRWLWVGAMLVASSWTGCSGSTESQAASGGNGGSAGTAGSGGNAGSAGCQMNCAVPPAGCHFEGEGSCNPPKCPPVVCEDSGKPDAPVDAPFDSTCQIDCGPPPDGCHFVGEPTCNPPKCPPMECVDADPDAPLDAHADSSDGPNVDAGAFPDSMVGTWLIGWSGGMNHYSWVRLSAGPGWAAEFLAGAELMSNVPYWDCTGTGSWMLTAKVDTIGLYFPTGCTQGFQSYTVLSFDIPTAGPPKAVLHATLESLITPGQAIEGYKFPSDQCDAAMSACADPWP